MRKDSNPRAIDLYSGIGGWTLGMKMSSVQNTASYEWWSEANHTHNLNFGTDHQEVDIRELQLTNLPKPGTIDLVLGSPPCTQFSFANRGGNGDLSDGLKDVHKFLQVVQYLKPRYWAMENVPRVSRIIEREIESGGQLYEFKDLFTVNIVVNAADYGVPQARKRMIAGNFPIDLFDEYKNVCPTRTMQDVLEALSQKDVIVDPIFGYQVPSNEVSDNYYEEPLSHEEERINRSAKTYHPVYNKMNFPDLGSRPSRTITATCTRVSRESIIVEDHRFDNKFRRLNIRERALIQSFPITFNLYGRSFSSRFKMIGNAIPPLLSYYIIQSMLETPTNELKHPQEVDYEHRPSISSEPVKMDTAGKKYPAKRSFRFAIPNLRFGSGVRFELANSFRDDQVNWEVSFYHGNSKEIKHLKLNEKVLQTALATLELPTKEEILRELSSLEDPLCNLDHYKLQEVWCKRDEGLHPFTIIDELGNIAQLIVEKYFPNPEIWISEIIHSILEQPPNQKLERNSNLIIVGFIIGSWANYHLHLEKVERESKVIA